MRIVALLDHSVYGESVLGYAGEIAARSGAGVDLVHVLSPGDYFEKGMVGYHPGGLAVFAGETIRDAEAELAAAREAATALLARARAALVEQGAGLVRTHVLEGTLPDVVRELATDAALVILGKRGEHADFARLHLGVHVEAVVRACTGPVLLAPRAYRPIGSCLVAFDADEGTARVIEGLSRPGLLPVVPVRLLHVGETSEALQSAFGRAIEAMSAAGWPVTAETVDGLPARVVAETVVREGFGLVAAGASNASRLTSLIFGSLTNELVRATQTPVLLA